MTDLVARLCDESGNTARAPQDLRLQAMVQNGWATLSGETLKKPKDWAVQIKANNDGQASFPKQTITRAPGVKEYTVEVQPLGDPQPKIKPALIKCSVVRSALSTACSALFDIRSLRVTVT